MSRKEAAFAHELSLHGFQFERNCRDLPGTPDIVFRREPLAVFFHGCFWHSHHCRSPTKSLEWRQNLKEITQEDKVHLVELRKIGFHSLVVWECEWEEKPTKMINLISERLFLLRLHQ